MDLKEKPDPGDGYRLLGKNPPEELKPGDEWWELKAEKWRKVFPTSSTDQCPTTHYRRKDAEPILELREEIDIDDVKGGE